MEIIECIMKHPDRKNFLREILNGTTQWLFITLCQLDGLHPEEAKRFIRGRLEEYLQTQKRLSHECSRKRGSYKDFLNDEETTRAAMLYLVKTLIVKFNDRAMAALIAVFIGLERREVEFGQFKKEHPNLKAEEALVLFWGQM
jgi:hypothetical protein